MVAFTTGTLGLLAVGTMMLVVTPARTSAPLAISSTSTPTSTPTSLPVSSGSDAGSGTGSESGSDARPLALRGTGETLATPIGEGRFAVVTSARLTDAGLGTELDVNLAGGRTRAARVVGRAGETVLVELDVPEPGVDLAHDRPERHEIVTVLAQPPVTIHLADLDDLDVAEGTAVLDDDGDLVGLCSEDEDGTRLMAVSEELAGSTNDG